MQNEWILDVLADLSVFAQKNGLGPLAERLDDTRLYAAAELSSMGEGIPSHETLAANAVRQPLERVGKRL